MAHKPLIGGTAYEIVGGKDLIGGTVYEKDHGKTLVGGTAYEVGFGSSVIVNVIIPSGCTNGYPTIDGIEYKASGTYEALESISIRVTGIVAAASGYAAAAHVYLNNVHVAQTPFSPPILDYSLSLDGCSEVTIEYKYGTSVYDCYITTT